MAWRIVKQPNGLLARFSETVDNFTHINMTPEEALDLCMEVMDEDKAKDKVQRGIENNHRWNEAIGIIRRVHKEDEIEKINTMIELSPNLNSS
jgi:hypothetical protein